MPYYAVGCLEGGDYYSCESWFYEMSYLLSYYYPYGGSVDPDELAMEFESLANSSSACDVVWTDSNGNNIGEGMELSGLVAGSYTASRTHSNGCTSTQTVDVGSAYDECGVCDGDNSTCLDECGVPNGDNTT